MSTLLLRLAAPMQSWGVGSKFDRRSTENTPSKSAIIGMVAASLGMQRNEDISNLRNALCFGVRTDREGILLRDYHTVKSEKSAYVTNRYYLCDAVFLAGLQGDEALLKEIEFALNRPAYPLFLGRRSCPPEGQVNLGIRYGKRLIEALSEEPRIVENNKLRIKETNLYLRVLMDAELHEQDAYFFRDNPISFNQAHRMYGFRRVHEVFVKPASLSDNIDSREQLTEHNPWLELEV